MNLLSAWLVSFASVALLSSHHWRKIAYWTALATVLFVNASIYYEAAGFAQYTRIPGRLSGFPVDPNDGPITTCLMLGICFTLQPAFWKNLALVAFATPAIALTMSRSGMAIFAFMVGIYVLLNARRHFTGLVLIALACIPLAVRGVPLLPQRTGGGPIKHQNTKAPPFYNRCMDSARNSFSTIPPFLRVAFCVVCIISYVSLRASWSA